MIEPKCEITLLSSLFEMKLLTTVGDLRAFKVFIVSKINGVSVENIVCEDPESRSFRKSYGKDELPILETEEGDVVGSSTIAIFVARQAAAPGFPNLLGSFSPLQEARVGGWMEWCSAVLEPTVARCVDPILFPERFDRNRRFDCLADAEISARGDKLLLRTLRKLETALEGRPYLVGDTLTLADVAVVSALYYPFALFLGSKIIESHPNLTRYYVACMTTFPFRSVLGRALIYCRRQSSKSGDTVPVRTTDDDKVSDISRRLAAAACALRYGSLANDSVRACLNTVTTLSSSSDRHPNVDTVLMEDPILDRKLEVPDLTKATGMAFLDKHFQRRNFLFEGVLTKQDLTLRSAVLLALRQCIDVAKELDTTLDKSVEEWRKGADDIVTVLARCLELDLDVIRAHAKKGEWKTLREAATKESRRLRKVNGGCGQHIGKTNARRPLYPNVRRWFEHVGRLQASMDSASSGLCRRSKRRTIKQPSDASLRWSQTKKVRLLKQVPACQHPLYKSWFELLSRNIPIAGVRARMPKSLDKSLLETPNVIIPIYESETESNVTHLQARELKTLTRDEACNLLINASKPKNKELQLTNVDLGVIARGIAAGSDSGVRGGGKFLCNVDEDGLLELDGCSEAEKEARETLRLISDLKTKKISFALLKSATITAPKRPPKPLAASKWLSIRSGIKRLDNSTLDATGKKGSDVAPIVLGLSFQPPRSSVSVAMTELRQTRDGKNLEKLIDMIDPEDASSTVVAFDFDLTLKGLHDPLTKQPRIRDSERTMGVLRKLKEMNVCMVVVTAQFPSRSNWTVVKGRAASLGIADFIGRGRRLVGNLRDQAKKFYDSVKADKAKCWKGYPSRESLLEEFASQYAKSYPEGDGAARLGRELDKLACKRSVNWKKFSRALARISPELQMEPPRYDAKCDPEMTMKYGEHAPKYLFSRLKSESGKNRWPCWACTTTRGKRIVAGEGFIMSEYDKADSLHAYLHAYKLRPKHIIFVDDFVGNVHNVAWYFSCKRSSKSVAWPDDEPLKARALSNVVIEPLVPDLKRVTSVWWNPRGEYETNERTKNELRDPAERYACARKRFETISAIIRESLARRDFATARRVKKFDLMPLSKTVKEDVRRSASLECTEDIKSALQELDRRIEAEIGVRKSSPSDVSVPLKRSMEESIARLESRVEMLTKCRDYASIAELERTQLAPLKRTRSTLLDFSNRDADEKTKDSFKLAKGRIDAFIESTQDHIDEAVARDDLRLAAELHDSVLRPLEHAVKFLESECDAESGNTISKGKAADTASSKCVASPGSAKPPESKPKVFLEKSTSKAYVGLVSKIKARTFPKSLFYPHLSGRG